MIGVVVIAIQGGDIQLNSHSITKTIQGGKKLKTIRWEKKEYVDVGFGFTGIITYETTLEGLVAKAFVYKGLHEDEAVHLTSVLSKEFDSTYLYSLIFRVLSNRKLLEQVWAKSLRHKDNNPEE